MEIYGRFESYPCVYDEDDQRGFVLFDENYGWRKISYVEIKDKAGMIQGIQRTAHAGSDRALARS